MSDERQIILFRTTRTVQFRTFSYGLLAALAGIAGSSDAAESIRFSRDVRPILSSNCFECHGFDPDTREAGLRLDTLDGALAELESGEGHAIVPGLPDQSVLLARIISHEPDEKMPPEDSGKNLTEANIKTLRQWIAQGAKYERHWAFVTPKKPTAPLVKDQDWIRNPIDAFVLARLEQRGMAPNVEATAEQLIRRVTLDLTGLPPTFEEIDAFLKDKKPDAYDKVVDRLLASRHYGERLAVPWLDAARYADTNGFSIDDHRDMWLWREWVIDALNRNMPYDQFVVEQIAGDLLPDATDQQRLATGFLRNSMNTHEGGTLPEEYRVIYIADKINTVSTVFMGLTMRCAQCHSHKYDPITQLEYYKFYAFFDTAHEPGKGAKNGNTSPTLRMDGLLTDSASFKRGVDERIATLKQYQLHPPELIKARAAWETATQATAKGDLGTAINIPADERNDAHWATINAAFAETTRLWGRHVSTIDREIAVLTSDLEAGKSSVMVMKEQGPRQTYLLTRGQYDQPDKEQSVGPGVPESLPSMGDTSPKNRLGLARWLTRGDHPLTARIAVNRYWQMLFGRGLVSTPDNFGSQGAFPTHPALLDWLAFDFSQNGWNTKRLIKTILMSATYRQSSSAPRSLIDHDPNNELLARAPRYRLSAEFIRDGALAIAGKLDTRVGGPSVYPRQPHGLWHEVSHFGNPKAFSAQAFYPSDNTGLNRRSMYTFWKRTSPPPSMIAFDAPTREVCAVQRSRTNTPLQALVLLNDPEYVGAARALATLAIKQGGTTVDERIRFIFRRATGRLPEAGESKILHRRFDQALDTYQQNADAAKALSGDGTAELAAWTVVTSIVLNLDEVITRE